MKLARRSWPAAVAWGVIAVAVPFWGRQLASVVGSARAHPLRASTHETLASVEGELYAAAIDETRRAIPPDGTYAIVGSADRDRTKWIRYELAPRRPWYAGDRDATRWVFRTANAPPEVPRWAVLAGAEGEPPELVPTASLAAHGMSPDARLEDAALTGWLDDPAEGSTARGAIVVRGWCQEAPSRPCAQVLAWVDGRPVAGEPRRAPRPDVCAAFPALGTCERAGFALEGGALEAGTHEVTVLLVTGAGRWRRIGPRPFRSAP